MTKEEMEALRCGDFVYDKDGTQYSVVANYGKGLKVIASALIINEDLCHLYQTSKTPTVAKLTEDMGKIVDLLGKALDADPNQPPVEEAFAIAHSNA